MGVAGHLGYIGVGLALMGHIMINFGVNLMKLAHQRREAQMDQGRQVAKSAPRHPTWQLGFASFFFGTASNFTALGLAAQSVVAAIGSIQFVSNVVFARYILHEQVTTRVVMATCIIIVADALLVLQAPHAATARTAEELMLLYQDPPYLAYLSCALGGAALCHALYSHVKARVRRNGANSVHWAARKALPFMYAIPSAAVGSQSVLFAKCLSTLTRATIEGDNQLGNWFLYVMLLGMAMTQFLWLHRLNNSLRQFDALTIVPTMQICWTFFSMAEGLIYFHEYCCFSQSQWVVFWLCVSFIVIGVFLLSPRTPYRRQGDEENAPLLPRDGGTSEQPAVASPNASEPSFDSVNLRHAGPTLPDGEGIDFTSASLALPYSTIPYASYGEDALAERAG